MPKTGIGRVLSIGSLLLAALAPPAHADWIEVSSDHFVIYANQSETEVRRFAERLERFHAAMAHRFKVQAEKPSPSNRVTIYVVSSQSRVRRLSSTGNPYVAGFYNPRAGATIAVIPKLERPSSDFGLAPETILFHEYAHHFLYGITARVFPRWFVEGFAEFFAAVKFQPDGGVGIGAIATHRAYELVLGRDVPMDKMLDFDGGGAAATAGNNAFYGQSWLLFHYLMFAPERAGQMVEYQALLAAGKPALDAATAAFGDLKQLEKDLARYQKSRELKYLVIGAKALSIGEFSVRELRKGEAEMMPVRMQSRAGVDEEEAAEVLPKVRKIAGQYPDDPMVLASLAEAEFDAGNDDAAIAAADRAIAINPNEIDAHIQKGYALHRKARNSEGSKEAWLEARRQFVRANKVENDHPIALMRYYLTFREQGETPTKAAIDGLEWAMVLAPFDGGLRWLVAQQMIADERYADAARTLAPLAYSPHPGEHTDKARQLLQEIEARIGGETAPEQD